MTTRIYYFSATGNCMAVARQIADRIGADTVSIAKLDPNARIQLEHSRIGIVFPSYLAPIMGVPLIVERFIRRLDGLESVQLFAVCTCGGYEFANALIPLKKLGDLIRDCGGTLSGEYSVRMPMSNLDYKHIPVPISSDIPQIIEHAKRKTDRISAQINKDNRTSYLLPKWVARQFVGLIYRAFRKLSMETLVSKANETMDATRGADFYLPLTDRSITVSQNCNGCGTCVNVCPAHNILLNENKPEFQHHCEMCFACDEWCPKGAIQHWSRGEGIKYHYPTIRLKDMI